MHYFFRSNGLTAPKQEYLKPQFQSNCSAMPPPEPSNATAEDRLPDGGGGRVSKDRKLTISDAIPLGAYSHMSGVDIFS